MSDKKPDGSKSTTFRAPAEIRVGIFRQMLIWPVLLDDGAPSGGTAEDAHQRQLSSWVEMLSGNGWRERELLPKNAQAAVAPRGVDDLDACDATYEEIVYFHPFVRDLLYGDGREATEDRPMRRLVRDDVRRADVYLKEDGVESRFAFRVPRVELYLFKPLTALLVVELAWDGSLPSDADGTHSSTRRTALACETKLSLADVLRLQRRIRQAYPSYFTGSGAAGVSPASVVLTGRPASGQSPVRIESDFHRSRSEWAKPTLSGAEPPVASHWSELLKPLEPCQRRGEWRRAFRQIVDDRIPSMTFVSVDDPRAIAPGDIDRLTWCDDGGTTPCPYASEFLAARRERHCYDRFWRDDADEDRAGSMEFTTRYLCSGYHFVALGRSGCEFYENHVLDHWRRQYLRLGMLAHFQRAALLKFVDEMGEAVKLLKGLSPQRELDDPAFRERIQTLQMTYLKFLARAWFSEVSNQLQAQELFAWWSDLLGTRRLFEEVDTISDEIHSVINNRYGHRLDERAVYWAIFAALLALLGLLLGK